jgi:hypothetical protein
MMKFNALAGSGGRDRTGDLRIMIPPQRPYLCQFGGTFIEKCFSIVSDSQATANSWRSIVAMSSLSSGFGNRWP